MSASAMRALLLVIVSGLAAGSNHLPGFLERHRNTSVSPCEDFYEHACGGWAQVHAEHAYRSQVEQLDHAYNGRLAKLLEQEPLPDEPRFVQLLRNNYAACRRLQRHYVAEQFVRWLRDRNESRWNLKWFNLLRLLMSYALTTRLEFTLFSLLAWQVTETAELWLLQLQPPWPALTEEALIDEDWPAADFQLLTHAQFIRLYGQLQPMLTDKSELWQQVQQLEQQLWTLSQAAEVELEADDEQLFPPARWLLPLSLQANNSLSAAVWQRYLNLLPDLLTRQPRLLLAQYLQLRLLHKLQQLPAPTFTRQECAAQTRQLLTHAAVWLLQQQQSTQQHELDVATMQSLFEQQRARFELQLLANRNGFRPAAQRFLLKKLRRMQLRVGILATGVERSEQLQLLETHYAQLQLSDSDYYGNLAALMRQLQKWTPRLPKANELFPLVPDGFGSFASPFFIPAANMVVFPLAMLAPPLYRPQQTALYTHSAVGFLLAHELSHGFSPTDVHYDSRGKVPNTSHKVLRRRILTQSVRFGDQQACFLRHHGLKADEQFADINGLDVAYYSYVANVTSSNLTSAVAREQQQTFFLNFAQFFCQDEPQLPESSIHGGNRERVNVAVAGFQPFSKAFGCAEGKLQRSCQLY